MWISLPIAEQEMAWIERLGGPWRVSKDELYRRSGVEMAFVPPYVWTKWNLPVPAGPIISLQVSDLIEVDRVIAEGASWVSPVAAKGWGVKAGFIRFPSGLMVEVIEDRGPAGNGSEDSPSKNK